jgi:hypothetical protein
VITFPPPAQLGRWINLKDSAKTLELAPEGSFVLLLPIGATQSGRSTVVESRLTPESQRHRLDELHLVGGNHQVEREVGGLVSSSELHGVCEEVVRGSAGPHRRRRERLTAH